MAGGVGWAFCFGRQGWVVAPWLGLAPLFLLLRRADAPRLGFLHGLAFWLAGIPWIAPTLASFGGMPGWLGVALLVLLASYLGAFHWLFVLVARRVWLRGSFEAVVGSAAAWVAIEWLRGVLLGGFPWNLTGYAWIEVPGALVLSSWIGAYGVGFVAALANAGLARAVEARRPGPWLWSAGCALILLAWAARWAAPPRDPGPFEPRPVRLIQPNTPIRGGADAATIAADYTRLLEMSREACDAKGALLVWPESATWPFSWDRTHRLREDTIALANLGCPVLFNSTFDGDEGAFNAVLVVDRGGVAGRYDKRHLVPFGEEVPGWAAWVPGVPSLARAAGHFQAGTDVGLLAWGRERLGVSICFEITFPAEVAEGVRAGATTLVTVTNDAWYGDTWAPWQHFRAARFRAAENRRPLLRAATTGVSAWIDAAGEPRSLLGVGEQGVLSHDIAGRQEWTLYSRAPWLVPLACWLLAAFVILRSLRRSPQ